MTNIHNCLNCGEMDRRLFCRNLMLGASILGLGGSKLLAAGTGQDQAKKHKFSNPSNLTFEQVFQVAFTDTYIPHMSFLADRIGREQFLDILKKASSENVIKIFEGAADRFPKRDMAAFTSLFKNNPGMKSTISFTVVEETDRVFELNVTECLWAKTFLDAKAGDIGFAGVCFADYASATAFNPNIRMIRDKTLMQGHDCCNHRYVLKK
jgi:hypothetical protein